MKKYVIALDQGTTGSRAVAFDHDGKCVGSVNKEFTQFFPYPGWVEHDPYDILQSQMGALFELIKKLAVKPEQIAAIGITNQRETVVVWDKMTGKPVYNAIVWQCRRTAGICEQLKADGYDDLIKSKTGLVLDAYFSGTKIKWILENVKEVKNKSLLCGTIDTWLIYNLTKEKSHVTDMSNASRTMLFNINTLEWDKQLLDILGIKEEMLPKVVPSSCVVGHMELEGISIPIAGIAGDQQAALFGQACFEPGEVKNTYGTGCFILMNTADKPVFSDKGLITTIAWNLNNKTYYALEGSIFNSGSAVQWLRDQLGLIKTAAETEDMAFAVEDTDDVYFVPAFTGLGTPHWDMYARGVLVGITRGTNKNHIARAVLESMAYQTVDVIDCMQQCSDVALKCLKVDGGASANNFLMQFQADMLNCDVVRPVMQETTSLGAAFLAGLAVGFWKDVEELKGIIEQDRIFVPKDFFDREYRKKRWHEAIKRSKNWAR
ncbi:MAG: Glycerol kinase [Firmicutes bacterium ADurb.Bin099]|nr:MAG: Glycerol kinase [Firmicutes bacterium ADurb.Bin099]